MTQGSRIWKSGSRSTTRSSQCSLPRSTAIAIVVERNALVVDPIWKMRLRVDRRPALAADAEALGVDELVAGDDADGEPGDVEALHVGRDIVLEVWDERFEPLIDRPVGGHSFRRDSPLFRHSKRGYRCQQCCGRQRHASGPQCKTEN